MTTRTAFHELLLTIQERYSYEALAAMGLAITLDDEVFDLAFGTLFDDYPGGPYKPSRADQFHYGGIRVRRSSAFPHKGQVFQAGVDEGEARVIEVLRKQFGVELKDE